MRSRRTGYKPRPILLFLLLQVGKNCFHVILELGCMGLPCFSDLFNYWIWFHGEPPMSSSGVQITGHSYPKLCTTLTMSGRICGLLMCWQFQVSRKCIPFTAATAMCKASSKDSAGIGPVFTKDLATSSTCSFNSSTGKSAMASSLRLAASESPGSASWMTNVEIVRFNFAAVLLPPIVGKLLPSRYDQIPARATGIVAQDAGFNVNRQFPHH